jgi:hypothetical protein
MIRTLVIQTPLGQLHGQLNLPDNPRGLVLLARAHHAPIDAVIAANLAARGYGILNMELLTAREAQFADATQNVPRLSQRLLDIIDLIRNDGDMQDLPLAIYATGDATPAAIRTAAQRDTQVKVLAAHGGIIDRAGLQGLNLLVAPLLMLFDADDHFGETAYRRATVHLKGVHEMHVLHSGEDPVVRVAAWLGLHLH